MPLDTISESDIEKEAKRIKDLDSYEILGSLPDKKYDDIVRLASFICETEISLINLMDSERKWFKSIQVDHTIEEKFPMDISFCKLTVQGTDLHEIRDTAKDIEWKDHPVVEKHKIRYYAGCPLVSPKGYKIGTLCVIDRTPKALSLQQKNALRTLANSVVYVFELDKNKTELQTKNKELAEVNARLFQFGRMIAHDLKSPLQSMRSLYELMRYDEENTLDHEGKMKSYLERLAQMIDGLLAFARNNLNSLKKEKVDVKQLIKSLTERLGAREINYSLGGEIPIIHTEGVLLEIIFQNLISNAIKYCNCKFAEVQIGVSNFEPLTFYVKDNGKGIAQDIGDRIFDPFIRIDKRQKEGCGIGLYTVKTILIQRGGRIWYESEQGQGTTFYFEWKI